MLNKPQKSKIIKELQDRVSRKEMAVFVSLQGVNVKDTQEIRRELGSKGCELLVVKKTLLGIVTKELGIDFSMKDVQGTFAIAFDYESQTQAVKTLAKLAKKTNLKMAKALWKTSIFDEAQLKELAILPDIEELRARLIILLAMPIRNLLALLTYEQKKLVIILNQLVTKKESLSTQS